MHLLLKHIFVSYSRHSGCTLSYYKATKIILVLDCGARQIATVAEEERSKSLFLCILIWK